MRIEAQMCTEGETIQNKKT